jgi:N-acetylglutamate synthase-like GNAT family acetyltransferase
MSSNLRLLSLHENQHFQNHVIELLNDEWPQSKTIRMRRLERSCNEFPLSYILIDNRDQLIGYCYVDRLLDDEQCVIIESVCIERKLRGKGYGRILMKLLEDKLRERESKIEAIYLTTMDKRHFYEKCGYEETTPRVRLNVSSKLFNGNEQLFKNLLANQISSTTDSHAILQKGSTIQRIPTVWMKKQISFI